MSKNRPVVLLLVEGWGIAPASHVNAISAAAPQVYFDLVKRYPVFALASSGLAVGLAVNEPGNREVGYRLIGESLLTALHESETRILAIGSPTGIERLQAHFFVRPLNDDQKVIVSSDQETNQIIVNVLETIADNVLMERADLVVANIIHIDDSATHGNVATTIDDIIAFDSRLQRVVDAVLTKHGTLIIASTHGNVEAVVDPITDLAVGNTTNPVPCVVVNAQLEGRSGGYDDSVTSEVSELKVSGSVARIAPTVVASLGLTVPSDIGESLV